MNPREVVVSKKMAFIVALVFAMLVALLVFGGKLSIPGFGQSQKLDSSKLAAGSPEKFAALSNHGTEDNVGST
jgi:hypothetical protein